MFELHAVRCVRYNEDGEYCLTGGADKTLKLWNPLNETLLNTYVGHGGEITDARATHDNSRLVSGSADKSIFIWDVATGQALRRYRHHVGRLNCVRFAGADHGNIVISASQDCRVCLWDFLNRSPSPLQVLDEAKDSVTGVFVHKWNIFTSSLDRNIRCYDLRKGELRTDFIGHPLTNITVSKDGQCVLVGCQDNAIRLFDAMSGELLNEYRGHKSSQFQVDCSLSSSDDLVISGSENGFVHFWDLLTSKQCPSSPVSIPVIESGFSDRSTSVINSLHPHPSADDNSFLTVRGSYVYLYSAAAPDK